MPGKIKSGSSSSAIVATYDIFPTVLKLAGAELPDVTLDGIDAELPLDTDVIQEEAYVQRGKGIWNAIE